MTGTGEPLRLTEVPEPTAGPGEVLVEVRAAGLCHTDVGILDDATWTDRIGPFPLTLGHEVAGVVADLGPGVTGWSAGDRVAVNPAGTTRPGLGRDGGYGPFVVADPADLVAVPEGLSFELAAAGTDAGRAPYRAVVVRGEVGPGDKVGIIGLGGLGQVGARIAVLRGAQVYAAEPKESLWPMARELGVHAVTRDIADFRDVGLDVVVDFAGFGTTTAAAIEVVREFGRVVQVGMGRLESTISTNALILKQVTLLGSRGGTVDDIAAVYEMFASGDLSPALELIGFDDIPAALDRLRAGEVTGRVVARYASVSSAASPARKPPSTP
ncbi:zinc-binding dehydrogenase [Nocardioides sp. SLBN-35]|uniref:zinc-binding dehydrogenase n=1 Tax=Nocardioides sp. SLBN-35 TaxID=2768445 RepID=UPI0011665234|nr:zinc-binding dehydrogenase [Nocardioides sp. SLBN-35]TQK69520.1 propanol-preferring alcohol dehydrogenase [Nocardioides sp. SLBN-35]